MRTEKLLLTGISAALIATPVTIVSAHQANDFDHAPIMRQPIADVKNNFWFDYLSDVREAEHELHKDLARATDDEDRADAREEYRNEIADANKDYIKEMRERGYRVGRVTVGR